MNSSFQACKQKKIASTESGYKYKKMMEMKMNSFLQKLGKKTDLDKKKRDVYITQLLLSSFI